MSFERRINNALDANRIEKSTPWKILVLAGMGYVVLAAGVAAHRAGKPDGTSDFVCFHLTGQHFFETGRITTEFGVKSYLPAFTILMSPLALLPIGVSCAAFVLGSIGLYVGSGWLIARRLLPAHPTGAFHKIAVPLLILMPYINACAVLGQVSLMVTAMITFGWCLAIQGRFWAAGIPLGIAILIKPFLLVALVFFALKRSWRVCLSSVVVMGAVGVVLPVLLLPWENVASLHQDYFRDVVQGQSSLALLTGDELKYGEYNRYNNQSLAAVVRRLTAHVDAGHSDSPLYVNVADMATWQTVGVFAVIVVPLFLWAGMVTVRSGSSCPLDRQHYEFAAFVLLGFILSPIAWTHYFVLVYYPLTLLTVRLMIDGDRKAKNRFGLGVWVLWVIAAVSFVMDLVWPGGMRAVGIHQWATILLTIAMLTSAARFTAESSSTSDGLAA